jgi:hypothetical protein
VNVASVRYEDSERVKRNRNLTAECGVWAPPVLLPWWL